MANVLHKGIEWRRTFTSTDDDTGERSNLTGLDIEIQFRRRTTEANALSYTVGAGLTLATQSGDTEGQFALVVPALDSVGLETANYAYRVLIDDQVALDWTKLPVRD